MLMIEGNLSRVSADSAETKIGF